MPEYIRTPENIRKDADFRLAVAIRTFMAEAMKADAALRGTAKSLPSITLIECVDRIIESAMRLQEAVERIQSWAEKETEEVIREEDEVSVAEGDAEVRR